jgi:phenylalanine-4-hydroxylase
VRPLEETNEIKLYGRGLISSHGDAATALGPKCERRPFSLDAVISEPFAIDHFQNVLFVVDLFGQLFQAVEEMHGRLRA